MCEVFAAFFKIYWTFLVTALCGLWTSALTFWPSLLTCWHCKL